MKIIALTVSFLTCFFSIGQKSYYFSEPQPQGKPPVTGFQERYFGRYTSANSSLSYEIDSEGIAIISTQISSLDRKTIRESSKYDVRNNYIFGIVEGDSIPCILEDNRYYFGVRSRDVLISKESLHRLIEISSGLYVLNYWESGLYTPALLKLEKDRIEIYEFNYDLETTVFDAIADAQTIPGTNNTLVLLRPTAEEFEALRKQGIFGTAVVYKKENAQ